MKIPKQKERGNGEEELEMFNEWGEMLAACIPVDS